MDRTTLRGVAFWTTVVTALMELMFRAIYAFLPFVNSGQDLSLIYRMMSVAGFFIAVVSTGSFLLFLGLVHYDLMTAQRLSEHARDYLIRDLTQPSQENKSHHG